MERIYFLVMMKIEKEGRGRTRKRGAGVDIAKRRFHVEYPQKIKIFPGVRHTHSLSERDTFFFASGKIRIESPPPREEWAR